MPRWAFLCKEGEEPEGFIDVDRFGERFNIGPEFTAMHM